MAAVYSKELWPGRESRDGIQRLLKHTRVFEVRTDDPEDDGVTAGAEASIPRNGDPHPNDANRLMIDIHATNDSADPTLWTVTCYYDSLVPKEQALEVGTYDPSTGASIPGGDAGDTNQRADNPINRPPRVNIDWETEHEIMDKDANGDPVVNSAGMPFDPPYMRERSRPIITVVINYAVGDVPLDLDVLDTAVDCVNDATWAGRDAGTCRIMAAPMHYEKENGIDFGQVAWRIKYKREGWNVELIDQGAHAIDGGELLLIGDVLGTGKDEIRLLDGSGGLLPLGDPPEFLPFTAYQSMNFSFLGL